MEEARASELRWRNSPEFKNATLPFPDKRGNLNQLLDLYQWPNMKPDSSLEFFFVAKINHLEKDLKEKNEIISKYAQPCNDLPSMS